MFHPGCYGELVGQILRYDVVWDISRLAPIKPIDEVTVPAAVGQQWRCPVWRRAGGGKKVGAAWSGACGVYCNICLLLIIKHTVLSFNNIYIGQNSQTETKREDILLFKADLGNEDINMLLTLNEIFPGLALPQHSFPLHVSSPSQF